MMQPTTLRVEHTAGKRATHVVYYIRARKQRVDGLWAKDAEDAENQFLAFAAELGWNVSSLRVETRESASHREVAS